MGKTCKLCGVFADLEGHHLIPLSEGGSFKPQVRICHKCHVKIHKLFTHKELAEKYNTFEALLLAVNTSQDNIS